MGSTGQGAPSRARRLLARAAALLACALLAGACVAAQAAMPARQALASTALLDSTQEGAISVTLHDASGKVAGGELALYRVASAVADDTGWHFVWDGAYASMGDELSAKTGALTAAYASSLAERLAPLVAGRAADRTARTDADGTVTFSGLAVGMYLVEEVSADEGLAPISPFVVTVPVEDATTGALLYRVDASPKAAAAEPAAPAGPAGHATVPETAQPPTSAGGQLPKTGQDWAPILPLAACGLVLVIAGGRMLRRDDGRDAGRRRA